HERKALAHHEKMNARKRDTIKYEGDVPNYVDSLKDAVTRFKAQLQEERTPFNELSLSRLHDLEVHFYNKIFNDQRRSKMSIHIVAKKGDIADTILLPGEPLRAKYIAENYLEDVIQYNDVRGMLGFTGTYKGKRISVQGTGMGVPSISIYVNELIQ